MNAITEVFLEAWDDAQVARRNCDARVAKLEQQGFHCSIALLYNALTGKRIYLLEATISDKIEPEIPPRTKSHQPASSRPQRKKPSRPATYEDR